jgi:hypothetical protein
MQFTIKNIHGEDCTSWLPFERAMSSQSMTPSIARG